MAKLDSKTKDNPRLEQRELKDGRTSLYLEYYLGRECTPLFDEYDNPIIYESGKMVGKQKCKVVHHRKKENLDGLYLYSKPRTPIEKEHNRQTLKIAQKIRFEREQELLEHGNGYRLKKEQNIDFLQFFQAYLDKYTKKDIKVVRMALNRFKSFLTETSEYKHYKNGIQPEQIDRDMITTFTEYLQSKSKGSGAQSLYKRFKKVVKYAVDHDIMKTNPCNGITIRVDENALTKDILSIDEINILAATEVEGQNQNIRRAALFCLIASLRYCDVKHLRYADVDYSNKMLWFDQDKTTGHSSASRVNIPLDETLLSLIGKPESPDRINDLIFPLPTNEACNKALKHWVARAGISKHITWHCLRHTSATNMIAIGVDIKTVASQLGHSTTKYTDRYIRAVDGLKRQAITTMTGLININPKTKDYENR